MPIFGCLPTHLVNGVLTGRLTEIHSGLKLTGNECLTALPFPQRFGVGEVALRIRYTLQP